MPGSFFFFLTVCWSRGRCLQAWTEEQGQSTCVADTMDGGPGDSTQGQSTPLTDEVTVKLGLPWSVKEEPQDQPSAVYSTAQPTSDSTTGSSLPGHECQRCSAVFMLSDSLGEHMLLVHGEMVESESSRFHGDDDECSDEAPNRQGRLSAQMADTSREDSTKALSNDFFIKLEPPCSVKDEPKDVYSTVQPLSNSTSGSPLSLNTSYVCQCCSAAFVLISSLELHAVTIHGETLQDWFPLCSEDNFYSVGYDSKKTGNSLTETDGVGYVCGNNSEKISNCYMKTSVERRKDETIDSDISRTEWKKMKRQYVCDVCSKAFKKSSHLKEHKFIHSSRRVFVCNVCGGTFSRAGNLRRHRQIHFGEKQFECLACSKRFLRACELKVHVLVHTGEKSWVCDICNKAFSQPTHLKQHRAIHTGHKPFVCEVCSKAFIQSGDLKRHKVKHTGHKPFMCDVCSKGFTRSVHLKKHKLSHVDQKPFVCELCNIAFVKEIDLRVHNRIHRSYKCAQCTADFVDMSSLQKHIQSTHSRQRRNVCEICGSAFSKVADLRTHKKTHEGERCHVCDVCGASFSRTCYLTTHRRIHSSEERSQRTDREKDCDSAHGVKNPGSKETEEKRFKCPHCPAVFTRLHSVKRHIQKLH